MLHPKKQSQPVLTLLFFLAIALLSSWPLWFYSMKFDILDQYLPWRMLVGDCIQHGVLPLWNPYTHLGYPLHADPQSGAWYPVTWLIGGTAGYNLYWIHAEYILHVWLAGFGMYLLTRLFIHHHKVALLAGMAYMLSGFFTGNAQHITWIISGCWLPFLLWSFIRLALTADSRYILLGALFFFLMFTGGYPAFLIVTVYILFALTILFPLLFRNRLPSPGLYIKNIILLALVTITTGSVMLVSSYESFQLAGRAEGLSRHLAMANPFSPQSMLSFLFPLSAIRNGEFFQTDVSMSNGFFGLMMLATLLYSLFHKKTVTEMVLWTGSTFFLLAAMGDFTPVRGWMYDFLPLMKLFRMPSLFRLFAITGFIILSSLALQNILKNAKTSTLKNYLRVFAVMVTLSIVAALVLNPDFSFPEKFINIANIPFPHSFILQGLVMLLSIIVFFLVLNKRLSLWFLGIDLILTAWICAPVTLVSNIKAGTSNNLVKQQHEFPLPSSAPMLQFKDRTDIVPPYWCNLGILRRQPIYDGYNNFQTRQYLAFEASPLFAEVLKNPLVYITGNNNTSSFTNPADTLFIYNDSSHLFMDAAMSKMPAASPTNCMATLTHFDPLHFTVESECNTDVFVTVMQQHLPQWRVRIDGKENKLFTSNGFTMSVQVPAGKHTLQFEYINNKVRFAFYLSAFMLTAIILLLVFGKRLTSIAPFSA